MTNETPEVEAEVEETLADDEPVKVEADDEVLQELLAEEDEAEEILGATPAEEVPEPDPEPEPEDPYAKYQRLLDQGYKPSQLRAICNGKGALVAVELA